MSNVNKLVKHTGIYAVGKVSGQLIGFIMLPVYTRYLEPADYGIIGLLTIAMLLISRLFGAQLVTAIPKFYYAEQSAHGHPNAVISTALLVTAVVSLFSTLALIIFRDELASSIFGSAGHGFVLAVFSITLVTTAIEHYALTFIRLQDKPYLFVNVNISKLVVQLGLNIWLVVFLDLKVLGVAISAAASSTIFALALLIYTTSNTGLHFDRGLAIRMIRFTWPLWVSSLAAIYIWSSSRLYLRYFASLEDVGLLELAAKFASVLILICWEPFFQYWQMERFKLYEKGHAEAAFRSVFYFITTTLVIIGLGISIFAEPVIRVMASPAFHGASQVVPFLVLAALFNALVEFSNFAYLTRERTDLIGKITHLMAIISTLLFLLAVPVLGLYGAAIALLLTRVVHFLITDYIARRYYDPGISLVPLAQLIMFSAAGYVIANILLKQDNIFLDIAVKSLVYGVFTGALVFVLVRDPAQRERVRDLWLAASHRVGWQKKT